MQTDNIDAKGHISSVVPNIIHSIDAALLWSVSLKMNGIAHLPCHDCFSTTAGQASELGRIVRRSFIELVESNPLEKIQAELEARYDVDLSSSKPTENLPSCGSLDLEAIMDTDHSFR